MRNMEKPSQDIEISLKVDPSETVKEDGQNDPWAVKEVQNDGPSWNDMKCGRRILHVLSIIIKVFVLFGLVYLFICALSFLGNAFKLLGGKIAGQTFRESELLSNPVTGLMIGVLATVLLQSSSTTTSIIITMVGAKLIPLQNSIPMVMGANIGTSVTNTIVSLAQSGDRQEFRKAFGGATVHDMFNWLSVLILLPLEVVTNYLYHLTGAIVESLNLKESSNYKKDMLKKLTKPFTNLIVKVNKNVIKDIAVNKEGAENKNVLKRWCGKKKINYNHTELHVETFSLDQVNNTFLDDLKSSHPVSEVKNGNNLTVAWNVTEERMRTVYTHKCNHLFAMTDLSDSAVGAILLVVSLVLIIVSLILIVKLLNSLLKSPLAKILNRTINAELPGKLSFLTGYIAILVGTGVTMVIQSSSVFTSTLTPLVGVGILSIERMLPLTLGANIGTTLTGILAASAAPAKAIPDTLRVALCHLFFNISGVIIFYPIPFMRKGPIGLAKLLGNTTAKYRWFSVLYILMTFVFIPSSVFALSLAGRIIFMAVGIPLLSILILIIVINIIQKHRARILPKILQTWNFLPLFMHSLQPYDKIISKLFKCCKKTTANEKEDHQKTNQLQDRISKNTIDERNINENKGFEIEVKTLKDTD